MPAIAWWLWLYAGISNCPGLYRQPCQPDLCWYQRNHERTDCTFTVNWTHKKGVTQDSFFFSSISDFKRPDARSEERRVGKVCRSLPPADHGNDKLVFMLVV